MAPTVPGAISNEMSTPSAVSWKFSTSGVPAPAREATWRAGSTLVRKPTEPSTSKASSTSTPTNRDNQPSLLRSRASRGRTHQRLKAPNNNSTATNAVLTAKALPYGVSMASGADTWAQPLKTPVTINVPTLRAATTENLGIKAPRRSRRSRRLEIRRNAGMPPARWKSAPTQKAAAARWR